MSENSIALLQKAEEQAAKDIRNAREKRNLRLKQAKSEAASLINLYREKKEKKFNQLESLAAGPDADLTKKLEADTLYEISQMNKDYDNNKDKIVQVLLAAVTTVVLDVPESLKLKA